MFISMPSLLLKKSLLNAKLLSRAAFLSIGCLLTASAWSPTIAQATLPQRDSAIAQVTSELPSAVETAVINDAANRTGIPTNEWAIVSAEQRDWPNGCLGLGEPGVACTQAIVPGWRVVVSANQQAWVYRTDETGSQVRLAQDSTAPGNDQPYRDIDGHWAQTCIQRLNEQNILSGYPDNTFRPNNSITRAEYAALMNQAFPDVETKREAISFTDVPVYYWGQDAIQTAYQKGFLAGYPNQQFRPNDLVSRVEAYVALVSGLGYATPDAPQTILAAAYSDASSIPNYAEGAIAAATQQGMVINAAAGTNAFNAAAPATRAQIAATLCQIKYDGAGIPEDYLADTVGTPADSDIITLGQTCENTASGFTVDFPTGWMTNTEDIAPSCFVFDPESITLQEQSSSLDEAIHIRVDRIPYARATRLDDPTETIISRRETTIDGHEAIVTESQSNGRGLIPAGVNYYTYLINFNNRKTLIASTYDYADQPYERNQLVLEQMVNTLTFDR